MSSPDRDSAKMDIMNVLINVKNRNRKVVNDIMFTGEPFTGETFKAFTGEPLKAAQNKPQKASNWSNNAKEMRKNLLQYFNSNEGSVDWQEKMI